MLRLLLSDILGIFRGRWSLSRLTNSVAIFNMRSGRGKNLINGLWLGLTTLTALSIKYPWIQLWWIIFLIPCYLLGTYLLGYIDETRLGFWQREREKASTHANPYTERIESKLDSILVHVKDLEGRLNSVNNNNNYFIDDSGGKVSR